MKKNIGATNMLESSEESEESDNILPKHPQMTGILTKEAINEISNYLSVIYTVIANNRSLKRQF